MLAARTLFSRFYFLFEAIAGRKGRRDAGMEVIQVGDRAFDYNHGRGVNSKEGSMLDREAFNATLRGLLLETEWQSAMIGHGQKVAKRRITRYGH